MRGATRFLFISLMPSVALATGGPLPAADEWGELPEGTRTVLLVTGADRGYILPRGCYGAWGGANYRPALEAWLAGQPHAPQRVWIATGDVVSRDPEAAAAEFVFENLSLVPYDAIGIGAAELEMLGAERLAVQAAAYGLPFVSANLRVFETGTAAFAEFERIETPSGSIAIVSASPHRPALMWGDASSGTLLTTEPDEALRNAVERARQSADLVVLAGNFSIVELRRLLPSIAPVDLALTSSGPSYDERPRAMAGVPVLRLGDAGRVLGRVALGAEGRILEVRGIQVRDRFPIDPINGIPLELGD
ncbi:MAG: hypothetical protein JSV80_02375 [Acidobacteriota bacterium]|nr:MAG: hypothetical protein JSV80_02375 [Acidobacteriota bacterium]